MLSAGDPDPSFGTSGVRSDLQMDNVWGSVIQSDGKIVLGGVIEVTDSDGNVLSDYGVVRRKPDGSLDTSFGNSGESDGALLTLDLFDREGYRVAPSGSFVSDGLNGFYASWFRPGDFVHVAHLLGSGKWDDKFGDGGLLITGILGMNQAVSDATYPNRPDGIVSPSQAQATSLAVDDQHRLVVVGSVLTQDPDHFTFTSMAMERYLPTGQLDPSFGTAGKVITTPDAFPAHPASLIPTSDAPRAAIQAGAYAVTFDHNHRLVVAGYAGYYLGAAYYLVSSAPAINDFAVARYNVDGSLDDGSPKDSTPADHFGTAGVVTTNFHPEGMPYTPDPRFRNPLSDVPTGMVFGGGDPVFINWQERELFLYSGATARTVMVDEQGRILVGGGEQHYLGVIDDFYGTYSGDAVIPERFAIVRYLPSGAVDTNFGNGGIVLTAPQVGGSETVNIPGSIGAVQGVINRLAIDPLGRIVAGGDMMVLTELNGSNNDHLMCPAALDQAVIRYNPDGSIDTTFAQSGIINAHVGGTDIRISGEGGNTTADHLASISITGDGNVLVAGQSEGIGLLRKFLSDTPVSTTTINSDLLATIISIETTQSSSVPSYLATTSEQVTKFLTAVSLLPVNNGATVNIQLDAQNNTFNGQTVTVPKGFVLTIDAAKFIGHSPSLTVVSGNVVVTNSTFTNSTDAPTILLLDGNLKLRNDIVEESDLAVQSAIQVSGGSIDLGSTSDPGGNTLNVRGAGVVISGSAAPTVDLAAGNSFELDGTTVTGNRTLQGMSWIDFNNDGVVDFGEQGLGGVTMTLSGTDFFGRSVQASAQSDSSGIYTFTSLWPGTYSISKGSSPGGYVDGRDALGTLGGTSTGNNIFSDIPVKTDDGFAYNFAERPAPGSSVSKGQSAGIGFWANKKGQALIATFAGIGPWLAATLPNRFGPPAAAAGSDLSGATPQQVAQLFVQQFLIQDKLDAQFMATALNVYATDATLGGASATGYGFQVSQYGLGNSTWNIGTRGAVFGVADNTTLRVIDILQACDQRCVRGSLFGGDAALRRMAKDVFGAINDRGGI